MEEIAVFLGLKLFNYDNSKMLFCSTNAQVTDVGKPKSKIIKFKILNMDI